MMLWLKIITAVWFLQGREKLLPFRYFLEIDASIGLRFHERCLRTYEINKPTIVCERLFFAFFFLLQV